MQSVGILRAITDATVGTSTSPAAGAGTPPTASPQGAPHLRASDLGAALCLVDLAVAWEDSHPAPTADTRVPPLVGQLLTAVARTVASCTEPRGTHRRQPAAKAAGAAAELVAAPAEGALSSDTHAAADDGNVPTAVPDARLSLGSRLALYAACGTLASLARSHPGCHAALASAGALEACLAAVAWAERCVEDEGGTAADTAGTTGNAGAAVATPALLIAAADAAVALLRPDAAHVRPLMPACEQFFRASAPAVAGAGAADAGALAALPAAQTTLALGHFGPCGLLSPSAWQWPPRSSGPAAVVADEWKAWSEGVAACWGRCGAVATYGPVFRLLRAGTSAATSTDSHGDARQPPADAAAYALCDTLAALAVAVTHVPAARSSLWAEPHDRAAVCVDLVRCELPCVSCP